jgi:hypothetical protein
MIGRRIAVSLMLLSIAACGAPGGGAKAPAQPDASPGQASPATAGERDEDAGGFAADVAGGDDAPAPPPPAQQAPADGRPGVSTVDGKKDKEERPAKAGPRESTALTSVDEAEEQLDEDLQLINKALGGAVALSEGGGCERVCRALGSMSSSVSAVCRLAGEDDRRCGTARGTLERTRKRVSAAGCGCQS